MSVPGFTYVRGAFIAYEPGGYSTNPQKKRVIPFHFNPESISRSIAVETAKSAGGVEGATQKAPAGTAGDTKADAAAGALKESFSIQIRLDFDDRGGGPAAIDEKLGVAPEIAAIEDLLHPAPSVGARAQGKKSAKQPASPRPTVLFVWGPDRILPVRIAALKIEESVYNANLYPVRAVIEASLEVLGGADVKGHDGTRAALAYTHKARRRLAQRYYEKTASMGPRIEL